MDFYEVIFLLQFLTVLIIATLKLFNVLSNGSFYDVRVCILTVIGFYFFFLVGLICILTNPTYAHIYASLFTLESWLAALFMLLFLIEIIFIIRDVPMKSLKGSAHMSQERKY